MSDKPEFDKVEKHTQATDNRPTVASSRRKPATAGPLLKLAAIVVVGSAAGFLLARDKKSAQPSEPSYTGPTTRTLFGLTLEKKTPPRATFSLLSGGKEYREAAYAASVDPEDNPGTKAGTTSGLLYSLSGPNPSRLSVNMEVAEPTPSELAAEKAARAEKEAKNANQATTPAPEYGSKMASAMKASQEGAGARGATAHSYQAQSQQGAAAGTAGRSRAANAGNLSGGARAQAYGGASVPASSSNPAQSYNDASVNETPAYQQTAGASNTQSFSGGQSSSYQSQNYSPGSSSVMPSAPSGSEDSAFMREMMDFVANRFSAYIPTLAAPVAGNPIGRGMAAAIPRNSGGSNGGSGADSARLSALQNESRLANGRAAAAEQAASQAYTKMAAMSEESKLAAAKSAEADQKARQAEEAAAKAADAARKAEQDASTSAAGRLRAEERARQAEAEAASARKVAQDALAAKLDAEKKATQAEESATRAAAERDTARTEATRLQANLTEATNKTAALVLDLDAQKKQAADALLAQQTAEDNAANALDAQKTAEGKATTAEEKAASALAAQQAAEKITATAEEQAASALSAQQAAEAIATQAKADADRALAAQQAAETQAAADKANLSKQLSDAQAKLAGAQGDTDALRGQLDGIYDAAKASGGVVISSDATMMPLGTMMTQVRNECASLKEAMETAVMSLEDNTAILTNQINCAFNRGGHCMSNMSGYLSSKDAICNVDGNGIFDNTVTGIMSALDQMQSTLQRSQDMSCDINIFSRAVTGGWECGIISPAKNSIFPMVNWINAKCTIYRPKRILENTYSVTGKSWGRYSNISSQLHGEGVANNGTLNNYKILAEQWDREGFDAKNDELTRLLEKEEGLSLWNFKRSLAGPDDADDSLPSRRDRWAKMLNSDSTCNYEQQDAALAETTSTLGTCDEIKTHNQAVCTEFVNNRDFNKDELASLTVYTGDDLARARGIVDDCDWFGCDNSDVEAALPGARDLIRAKALEGCVATYASSCPALEE